MTNGDYCGSAPSHCIDIFLARYKKVPNHDFIRGDGKASPVAFKKLPFKIYRFQKTKLVFSGVFYSIFILYFIC